MKDVFIENYVYKCIHYMSMMFGTWMTINSKMFSKKIKIIAYTTSFVWCLVIVGNQVNYVMKPWTEERKEGDSGNFRKEQKDATFQQINHFDFWNYNGIYFLSCFCSLTNEQIIINTSHTSKNSTCDIWRISIVFLLIVGNIIQAFLSYNCSTIQYVIYNLMFQDVCKLGILPVDLQFAWFCWSLEDRFSKLNDKLQLLISSETPRPTSCTVKAQWRTVVTRNNNYRYKIHLINITYGQLMNGLQNVRRVCEERVLMNVACYMFNAIYGLFNTISAYRTEGTPIVLVVVHLARVINCAGRITVICFAASSVVEQDDRLRDLAQIAKETSDTNSNYWETKRFLRRLKYSKVKFDVCSMITVDKTLLSSVVISIISYLVIVLQYNYS